MSLLPIQRHRRPLTRGIYTIITHKARHENASRRHHVSTTANESSSVCRFLSLGPVLCFAVYNTVSRHYSSPWREGQLPVTRPTYKFLVSVISCPTSLSLFPSLSPRVHATYVIYLPLNDRKRFQAPNIALALACTRSSCSTARINGPITVPPLRLGINILGN